jgi:hypothetical protein
MLDNEDEDITMVSLTYLFTYLLYGAEKLTGFQLGKKFPPFNGTKGSLLQSQVPATCPYPEPARLSPNHYIPLPEDLS